MTLVNADGTQTQKEIKVLSTTLPTQDEVVIHLAKLLDETTPVPKGAMLDPGRFKTETDYQKEYSSTITKLFL